MISSFCKSLVDCFTLQPQKLFASEIAFSQISDSLILCSQQQLEMSCECATEITGVIIINFNNKTKKPIFKNLFLIC